MSCLCHRTSRPSHAANTRNPPPDKTLVHIDTFQRILSTRRSSQGNSAPAGLATHRRVSGITNRPLLRPLCCPFLQLLVYCWPLKINVRGHTAPHGSPTGTDFSAYA